MRCKIVRFQKLIWCNMMRSIKSKKVSILRYSIDNRCILIMLLLCICVVSFHWRIPLSMQPLHGFWIKMSQHCIGASKVYDWSSSPLQ